MPCLLPEGPNLAAAHHGGWVALATREHVTLFDANHRREVARVALPSTESCQLGFTAGPTPRLLVVAHSEDGSTVHGFTVPDLEPVARRDFVGRWSPLAFIGERMLLGNDDGESAQMVLLTTRQLVADPTALRGPVRFAAAAPEERVLVEGRGNLEFWDPLTRRALFRLNLNITATPQQAGFASKGRLLWVASSEASGRFEVFRFSDGRPQLQHDLGGVIAGVDGHPETNRVLIAIANREGGGHSLFDVDLSQRDKQELAPKRPPAAFCFAYGVSPQLVTATVEGEIEYVTLAMSAASRPAVVSPSPMLVPEPQRPDLSASMRRSLESLRSAGGGGGAPSRAEGRTESRPDARATLRDESPAESPFELRSTERMEPIGDEAPAVAETRATSGSGAATTATAGGAGAVDRLNAWRARLRGAPQAGAATAESGSGEPVEHRPATTAAAPAAIPEKRGEGWYQSPVERGAVADSLGVPDAVDADDAGHDAGDDKDDDKETARAASLGDADAAASDDSDSEDNDSDDDSAEDTDGAEDGDGDEDSDDEDDDSDDDEDSDDEPLASGRPEPLPVSAREQALSRFAQLRDRKPVETTPPPVRPAFTRPALRTPTPAVPPTVARPPVTAARPATATPTRPSIAPARRVSPSAISSPLVAESPGWRSALADWTTAALAAPRDAEPAPLDAGGSVQRLADRLGLDDVARQALALLYGGWLLGDAERGVSMATLSWVTRDDAWSESRGLGALGREGIARCRRGRVQLTTAAGGVLDGRTLCRVFATPSDATVPLDSVSLLTLGSSQPVEPFVDDLARRLGRDLALVDPGPGDEARAFRRVRRAVREAALLGVTPIIAATTPAVAATAERWVPLLPRPALIAAVDIPSVPPLSDLPLLPLD